MSAPVRYRFATSEAELRQVHALNHQTFVAEIPQHRGNDSGMLVDRFDGENTYVVAMCGERVVGMVSLRDRRPFSLDAKLPDLDRHLPEGRRVCELRLLAVAPEQRGTTTLFGLLLHAARFGAALGFDAAVISGIVRQLKLYEHLGFVPFGPRVGTRGAEYQPMFVTLDAFRERTARLVARGEPAFEGASFLPGPVDLPAEVRAAFQGHPYSHRDQRFVDAMQRVKAELCDLTGASGAALMLGSGTLANDVVVTQLSALGGTGVVLANGEFGERLADHARRASLSFAVERSEWGSVFDASAIDEILRRHSHLDWLWMVHHETSTGVLNDLPHAAARGVARGIRVCADCVSSVGLVPVRLRDVWLASTVSGKALAAPPGMAMVLWSSPPLRTPAAPRYLDLTSYATDAVPFTQPSTLLESVEAAIPLARRRLDSGAVRQATMALRDALGRMGLRVLRDDAHAAPGIVTVVMRGQGDAERLGDALARAGLSTSYRSDYLRERNWIQYALFGECSGHKLSLLVRALEQLLPGMTKRLPATSAGSRFAWPGTV